MTDTFPSKCEAAKRKAAGKVASGELGCYAKAAATGLAVESGCLAKATGKFSAALGKAGTCPDSGSPQTVVESNCVAAAVTTDGGGVVTVGCSSGTGFTKITTGDIVTIPAHYWNGAWGDYDDDGYLDLFVGATFPSTRNYLYHNNQDGTFSLIDDAKIPKLPSNQHGAAWGDYDNDGHLDLIVTSGNPQVAHNALYHNNGDGSFSAVTDTPIYTDPFPFFHGPSWIDYDNDGFLDLFIAGHDIFNRLFHNNRDGSFTRMDSVLVSSQSASEGRVLPVE